MINKTLTKGERLKMKAQSQGAGTSTWELIEGAADCNQLVAESIAPKPMGMKFNVGMNSMVSTY